MAQPRWQAHLQHWAGDGLEGARHLAPHHHLRFGANLPLPGAASAAERGQQR